MKIKGVLFVFLLTLTYMVQSKKYFAKVHDGTYYKDEKVNEGLENEHNGKGMEKVFGRNWKSSDVKKMFDQTDMDYDDSDLVESDLFVHVEGSKDLIPMGKIKVKYNYQIVIYIY